MRSGDCDTISHGAWSMTGVRFSPGLVLPGDAASTCTWSGKVSGLTPVRTRSIGRSTAPSPVRYCGPFSWKLRSVPPQRENFAWYSGVSQVGAPSVSMVHVGATAGAEAGWLDGPDAGWLALPATTAGADAGAELGWLDGGAVNVTGLGAACSGALGANRSVHPT